MITETAITATSDGESADLDRVGDIPPVSDHAIAIDTDASANSTFQDADGEAPDTKEEAPIDYARIAREDLYELQAQFPSLAGIRSVAELPNPLRYGALRDLGLSPREAYLATSSPKAKRADNRAHLQSSIPRSRVGEGVSMSASELQSARVLFGNLSDKEIYRLYRKVQA